MKLETKKSHRVCVFVFPFASLAGIGSLLNLVKVLNPITHKIYLIMGNTGYETFKNIDNIKVYSINHERGKNPFTRVLNYVLAQIKISIRMVKLRNKVDYYLYLVNSITLFPILTAKLFNKNVILVVPNAQSEICEAQKDLFTFFVGILENVNYFLSKKIILYSKGLVRAFSLEKYKNKISFAHQHRLDFEKFKIVKPLKKRSKTVGYVGRLSEEKGIMELVKAIPFVLHSDNDVNFLIIGDGELHNKIQEYITNLKLDDYVSLLGWISFEELPNYFNEMSLLVLPSYTEALPRVMLEAMSCGTPVLATPVGAVSDVIKHEVTGFLIQNNKSESIAEGIVQSLHYSKLEEISNYARSFVKSEFTFEVAVKQYKEALYSKQ